LTARGRRGTVASVRAALSLCLAVACSGARGPREVRGPGDAPPDAAPAAAGLIVVAEHAYSGGRLILVDERGRRVRELTDEPSSASVDVTPSFSPDGRFVVFASSRGRPLPADTSLWIVAVAPDAEPRRLTAGDAVDLTPAVAPDGRRVAFASTRAGGLDLWILELEAGEPPRAGPARRLTRAAGSEFQPAWSPDGALVAYTAAAGERAAVMLIRPDGSGARELAPGSAPAFTPDGTRVAFAADGDLWLLGLEGGDRRRLTDTPLVDETHPRFSRDGRFLFATALVRDDDRRAVLSMVVFLDLADPGAEPRALQEAVPTSRNGADVGPAPLDAETLRRNPTFTEAVRRVLVQ
jgi:Tol biopolymer transport system component